MDRRAPPPPTPPRELRQPLAVVTPKRKRSTHGSPAQAATIRILPHQAARPVRPSPRRRQIPAPPAAHDYALRLLADIAMAQADAAAAAAAAAAAPPAPAPAPAPAAENLHASPPLPPSAAADAEEEKEKPYDAPPLPHLAVDHQNPSSTSIDHGNGDASPKASAAAPPAPAPARKNLRSSPPLPLAAAADEEKVKSCDAPPLPPLAVDEPQSAMSMDHDHAATKARAEDCKKAAFPQGNAGSSKGGQRGGGVASPGAGASPMELDNDDEELEPGEIRSQKPAAGRNADSARGSILGKYKPPVACWEPAAMGSSAHRAGPVAEMFAAMEKRQEVFVGGLSRDAVEEDVRAALSPAGEITEVRMFMDRLTNKNKGYCFVAYRDAAMASKAVAELGDVKIRGKQCRVAVPAGNEKTSKNAQRDPTVEDYNSIYGQRLGVHSPYITSWDPHAARHENDPLCSFNYVVPPIVAPPLVASQDGYYYPMYHNGNIMFLPSSDLNHGLTGPSGRRQMGQSAGSDRPAGQPHRSRN